MRFKALFIVSMMVLAFSASAQFIWPEDPLRKEAQTLWTIFDDSYKQGDFEVAKVPLQTLIEKYPTLSKSLYINGIKVWKESFKNEKDAVKKSEAAVKVMEFYKMRYDNFPGEEAKVIDRQANDAFQFFYKDKSKQDMYLIYLIRHMN